MINAYHAQIIGNSKRGGYSGGFQGHNSGNSGGRSNFCAKRCMIFNYHPKGIPFDIGHYRNSLVRGQMIGSNKLMHLGRSQFGTASGISSVEGNYESVVCQICFKSGHTATECWHRYIENYVPQQTRSYNKDRNQRSAYMTCFDPSSENYCNSYGDSWPTTHFGSIPTYPMPHMHCPPGSLYFSDSMSLPGAAYVANCEGPADEG